MKSHVRLGVARMRRDEHGAALLEFAFVLMMLLVLVFGIIDFGRALYTANSINLAAREGARYAAVCTDPVASTTAIQDTVIAHMTPFGSTPLTRTQVSVTYNYGTGAGTGLQSTTVRVDYPFTAITPVLRLLSIATFTLHASAQYRWELGA